MKNELNNKNHSFEPEVLNIAHQIFIYERFLLEFVMVFCPDAGIYTNTLLIAVKLANIFNRIFAVGAFNSTFLPKCKLILVYIFLSLAIIIFCIIVLVFFSISIVKNSIWF